MSSRNGIPSRSETRQAVRSQLYGNQELQAADNWSKTHNALAQSRLDTIRAGGSEAELGHLPPVTTRMAPQAVAELQSKYNSIHQRVNPQDYAQKQAQRTGVAPAAQDAATAPLNRAARTVPADNSALYNRIHAPAAPSTPQAMPRDFTPPPAKAAKGETPSSLSAAVRNMGQPAKPGSTYTDANGQQKTAPGGEGMQPKFATQNKPSDTGVGKVLSKAQGDGFFGAEDKEITDSINAKGANGGVTQTPYGTVGSTAQRSNIVEGAAKPIYDANGVQTGVGRDPNQWQKDIVAKYPEIGRDGSPQNKSFVEAYNKAQAGASTPGAALIDPALIAKNIYNPQKTDATAPGGALAQSPLAPKVDGAQGAIAGNAPVTAAPIAAPSPVSPSQPQAPLLPLSAPAAPLDKASSFSDLTQSAPALSAPLAAPSGLSLATGVPADGSQSMTAGYQHVETDAEKQKRLMAESAKAGASDKSQADAQAARVAKNEAGAKQKGADQDAVNDAYKKAKSPWLDSDYGQAAIASF